MANGVNKNGGIVSTNAHVSIVAKVVSISGSGSLATVVAQSPYDASTYSIQANDAVAVEQQADANHVARDMEGSAYGTAGDDISPRGVVTGISGSGQNALLTVKLSTSGNSITTAAGNVSSAPEVS